MHAKLGIFVGCFRRLSKRTIVPVFILPTALFGMCVILAQQVRGCTIEGLAIARSGDPLPGATVDLAISDSGPPIFGINSVTLTADGHGRFVYSFKETGTRAVDVHILVRSDTYFGEVITSHAIVRPETALKYTIVCGSRKSLNVSLTYPEGVDPATDLLLALYGESGRRLHVVRTDNETAEAGIKLYGDWSKVSIVAYSMNDRPKTDNPWWSGWKYKGQQDVTYTTSVGAATVPMNDLSITGNSVRSFRVPSQHDLLSVIALDQNDTPIWADGTHGASSAHIDTLSGQSDDTKSYIIRVNISDDVDRLLFMAKGEHLFYAHDVKQGGEGIIEVELESYEVAADAFHLLLPEEQKYLKGETAVTLRVWCGSYQTHMYCPISDNGGLTFYLPPEFKSVTAHIVALSDNEFCDTGLSVLAVRGKTVEFDAAESQVQTIVVSASERSPGPQLMTIRVGEPGTDNWAFGVQLNAEQKLVVRLPRGKKIAIWNAGAWRTVKLEDAAKKESVLNLCNKSGE